MIKKLNNIQTPLKIFISLGIIALIFQRLDIDKLEKIIAQIDISFWGYAVSLTLVQFFLLSLRWQILINVGKKRMSYMQSLQVTLASFLANTLFIATIGGIAVKICLALQYGTSFFKAIFATATDRFLTLFALVIFSSIFIPSLSIYLDGEIYKHTVIYIGVFTFLTVVLTPLLIIIIFKNITKFNISKGNMNSGIRYVKILISTPKILFKLISISLVAQLCFFTSIFLLTIPFDINLSFWQIMTVLPIISLIASLPISIGGWGVREGAFVYGLGLLGVQMEDAFLLSVQIGLISIFTIIITGITALINEKNLYKLKTCLIKK